MYIQRTNCFCRHTDYTTRGQSDQHSLLNSWLEFQCKTQTAPHIPTVIISHKSEYRLHLQWQIKSRTCTVWRTSLATPRETHAPKHTQRRLRVNGGAKAPSCTETCTQLKGQGQRNPPGNRIQKGITAVIYVSSIYVHPPLFLLLPLLLLNFSALQGNKTLVLRWFLLQS